MINSNNNLELILNHYESNWSGEVSKEKWKDGPTIDLPDDFCILKFAPNRLRNMWTYATCGMSLSYPKIELHLFSKKENSCHVELLTAIAHYHLKSDSSLGLWHTINFGRPWENKSECRFGLLSLPYLDGPKLEHLIIKNDTVSFLWLIPITERERNFKSKYGIEELENKFDEIGLDYLNSDRKSVV